MANIDIGAREGAFGALFQNLGAAFQSQMEASQRGAAAKARLKLDKKKFKVQQDQLAETKKKNTMNTALRRLKGFMPKGDMFHLKNNAPNVYKALVGQTLQQGFPEMDPKGEVFKTMLMGLLGDGPQVNNIVTFLNAYANKLTAKQRITLVRMVRNDPSALPDAMKQANMWADAFDEKATLTQMADKLKLKPGQKDTPGVRDAQGIAAIEKGLRGGLLPKDLSISAIGGLGGQMASRERTQIQSKLDLNRMVLVQAEPGGPTRSIRAINSGKWIDENPRGKVFSQQAMTGQAGQFLGLTKTQKGKSVISKIGALGLSARATRVKNLVQGVGKKLSGARGSVAAAFGSVLGQISPRVGDLLISALAGVDPTALSTFRTEAQIIIAESIPLFTGEKGSRVSGTELAISTKLTRARDPYASLPMLEGALNTIIVGGFLNADKETLAQKGKPLYALVKPDMSWDDDRYKVIYKKLKKLTEFDAPTMIYMMNSLITHQKWYITGEGGSAPDEDTRLWAGYRGSK